MFEAIRKKARRPRLLIWLFYNDLGRYHLVADVIDRVPKLGYLAAYAKQAIRVKKIDHKMSIAKYRADMPEIKDWKWQYEF